MTLLDPIKYLLRSGVLPCSWVVPLMCLLMTSTAFSHCNPIEVIVAGNQLTLAGYVADPLGFASQMFINPSSDCMLEAAPVDRLVTDIPGFDITGMSINSGLFLDPVVRTQSALADVGTRYLWYWDPDARQVSLAPDDIPFRIRSQLGFGTSLLPRDDAPVPDRLRIAQPAADDLGEHRHLLRYDFTGVPEERRGVYGFFAQMSSPNYTTSAPFLVTFGTHVSSQEVTDGALAINFAAGAGDFNGDLLLTCDDINQLSQALVTHDDSSRFDINGDAAVTRDDIVAWLAKAGIMNLPDQRSYQFGDANLDGVVDVSDFNLWNSHRGHGIGLWCEGEFSFDGEVDEVDFAIWNENRFSPSASATTPVPEPASVALVLGAWGAAMALWRRWQ